MTVRSIGVYKFLSRSRQELYGDDQLVHVWWKGNLWFAAAACFRAPKAMTWGDFINALVYPLFSCDPDFDPTATKLTWTIDDQSVDPAPDQSLESLGVNHKSLLTCQPA